jgi:D-alanyl-D-alanine carboxypeptidase
MRAAIAIVLLVATSARAESLQLDAPSAVVIDSDSGAVLLDRDADTVRPIASLTKIFVALVVRAHRLDLDGWTRITAEDVRAAAGGAGSALRRGEQFRNLDLLHAMLLVSDNRVPSALARSVGLSPDELRAAMNETAEQLGLGHTHFDDITGIAGNQSTARELATAMREVLRDPVLARIMRTRRAQVTSRSEAVTIEYRTTVGPLWTGRYRIRGGKTGTTEGAGHCMLIGATLGGRLVTIALLGGTSVRSRNADFATLAHWLGSRDAPRATHAAASPR